MMKLNQQIKTILPLAVAMGSVALSVSSANAAVTAALTSEALNLGGDDFHDGPSIIAESGDLLNTSLLTFTEGAVGDGTRHNASSMFDGTINAGVGNGAQTAQNAAGYWTTGSFIQFDLDTTTNTLGYDIDLINIIQRGDSFRPSINVAVSLRTVGGSFVEIHDTGAVGTGGNVNQVEITEDNGAALLGSGIDSVRFDFGNPGLNWTFYRELDVVGTATAVPEPTTTALLGLGGLALILRRRK